jgi:tetratricopeptide (TPR) repeat protein
MVTESSNPYVGPRPFERDHVELFFGREREVRRLASLVVSERVVLFYAASGAGKTSLLNAGLAPRLEERDEFEVFPAARVRLADEPPSGTSNVFVASVLTNWMTELERVEGLSRKGPMRGKRAEQHQASRSDHASLRDFLAERKHPSTKEGFEAPRLVVFDQAEELFTAYPEHWKHRQGFFEAVAEALNADPLLHVVFSMREDFIAAVDPHASAVPGGLAARFRLERLGSEAALRAVTGPLNATARHFAPGVDEKLVDDLLTFRIDTGTGEESIEVRGEFVEPVQLQVACQNLWWSLPDDVTEITEDHLNDYAVVDTALAHFYRNAIDAAAERAGLEANELSLQFEQLFITSVDTRGTAYRAVASTGGIPNEAIDELERRYLVRGEWSRGAHWYELTHDRMIDPIREHNRSLADVPLQPSEEHEIARRANAALARAEELRANGDLQGALEWATKAREMYASVGYEHAGVADALVKHGEILYQTGEHDDDAIARVHEGRKLYDRLGDRPAVADTWRTAGILEAQRGNIDGAVEALRNALALYRESDNLSAAVRTLDLLAQLDAERNDFGAAAELAQTAIHLAREIGDRDGEANARTTASFVLYHQEDYDAASRETHEALAIFEALGNRGAMAILVGNIGHIAAAAGDLPGAIHRWTQAIAMHRELGDHDAAASLARELVRLHEQREDYDAAADELSEALRWQPDDLELREQRAEMYWYAARFAAALSDYDLVLEADPGRTSALAGRGQVRATIGRNREALDDLDRALTLLPADSELAAYVQAARGLALSATGDLHAGLSDLDRSIAAYPGNAWAYSRRASVHEHDGDAEAAIADLESALSATAPPLTPAMRRDVEGRLERLRGERPADSSRRRWLPRVHTRS